MTETVNTDVAQELSDRKGSGGHQQRRDRSRRSSKHERGLCVGVNVGAFLMLVCVVGSTATLPRLS